MPPTSSTERVAKHRTKLRATADGAERINERGRSENRKHHLKVKRLKLEIAAYEKSLGIEPTNPIGSPRAQRILPPEDELRRMSMAELAEWKRRQRTSHRRQLSRQRSRNDSIGSLEEKLVTLQDMGFLVNAVDEEHLSGDSALSEPPSSDSNFKEELDAARVQGMSDKEEGARVLTNGFASSRPEFKASEEVHPADVQENTVDEDAYIVWLDTFVPVRDSNFSEEPDFSGMQELTDVILS